MGNKIIPVTGNTAALGNAWASVSASATNPYQVIGFSGGCSSVSGTVDFLIDDKIKLRYFTSASSPAIDQYFGELGPVTGTNSSIAVHTDTIASTPHHCFANLLYRIVL